jgi:hypothetical protein
MGLMGVMGVMGVMRVMGVMGLVDSGTTALGVSQEQARLAVGPAEAGSLALRVSAYLRSVLYSRPQVCYPVGALRG